MERTDTERINAMEENGWHYNKSHRCLYDSNGMDVRGGERGTFRECIDRAMSVSEAGEMEAAKTAYWTSGWELTKEHQMGGPVRDMPSYFIWVCNGHIADTPEQAVLKAYRASKGK